VAGELLQQFLLNHRRACSSTTGPARRSSIGLGETDESFLVAKPVERLRAAAQWLLGRHDRVETTAYLLYIAYQQRFHGLRTAGPSWPRVRDRLPGINGACPAGWQASRTRLGAPAAS